MHYRELTPRKQLNSSVGNYQEAITTALGIMEAQKALYPTETHLLYDDYLFLSKVYTEKGDRPTALEALSAALNCLASSPKHDTYWKNTAAVYSLLCMHSQAMNLMDKAIKYKELQLHAITEVVEWVLDKKINPYHSVDVELQKLKKGMKTDPDYLKQKSG